MKISKIAALCSAAAITASITAGCSKSNDSTPADEPAVSAITSDADNTAAASSENEDYEKYKVSVEGTKFVVDGKELWINGVNTPWDNWNDFGGNFDAQFWDEHFAQLHESGVNATRVWVNCAGMSIVRLRSDGTVQAVDEQHWTDLDTLFELAQKHDIYIMATLLSFDHFKDTNAGHKNYRALIQSEEATQSYIDSYVLPFVERYGNNPRLFSIDLMNEPDWVKENEECGKIGWEHLSRFFAQITAAIHENSDELVTVGLGMVKYNSDKYDGNYVSDEFLKELAGDNAYLDFYSPHYYFWQNSFLGYPFEVTPTEFGLDGTKPVVIGESAVVNESGRTPEQDYENAYNNGWNGVMAWTSNGVDACGSLTELMPAIDRIEELAPEKVFPVE